MPFALIPFVLLLIPLLEIAAFVVIGSKIGVAATLALVLATAIAGSILLRWQGFGVIGRIRQDMDSGRMPARELGHGALLMVAGVLLLTPGFVTDTLGFLLFIPAVRDGVIGYLGRRMTVQTASFGQSGGQSGFETRWNPGNSGNPGNRDARGKGGDGTIDLDPQDWHRDEPPASGDSPWRNPDDRSS